MLFRSLGGTSPLVSFAEATLRGQAPDGGLYYPERIIPLGDLAELKRLSKEELGYRILQLYAGADIPETVLQQIVTETVDFDFPLVHVRGEIYALELFHGPTLAFKDVGARFMSRCLGYFNRNNNQATTVLVATSGDTGGAVAHGFLGVEGVEVVILYPSGKVSEVQELQLTTCGQNITALEIDGTFDDCQRMVKAAFRDTEIAQKRTLTSANSINVARWLPQQLYYFYAWQQWEGDSLPTVSVPSGNFGNICAGLLAHVAGLPIQHFIAACNANDAVPTYFSTGTYTPKPAIPTLSNAMDVGDPSNLVRVLELFQNYLPNLKKQVSAASIPDEATIDTLKAIYEQDGYLLDPHGAVGMAALLDYLPEGQPGIVLETAHPVKFANVLEPILGQKIPHPPATQDLFSKEKVSHKMAASHVELKAFLLA